jgi:hypothetical protein
MKDYGDIENALIGGGTTRPGSVSFKVQWTAEGSVNEFDNADQKFRGIFRDASAQMDWSARTVDFEFQSAPLATSTSIGTELGRESNGSFY